MIRSRPRHSQAFSGGGALSRAHRMPLGSGASDGQPLGRPAPLLALGHHLLSYAQTAEIWLSGSGEPHRLSASLEDALTHPLGFASSADASSTLLAFPRASRVRLVGDSRPPVRSQGTQLVLSALVRSQGIFHEGEQGRVPLLILSRKQNDQKKRPAVVILHSSYKVKEWLRPLLEAYASRGYVAVAIDSRYHGERARSATTYKEALISSWKNGDTMPFIFDTVWDLIKLADYLVQREDIDPCRIGITGESLGGMHAWFAALADIRYAVVVPIIGVQGFRWAIDNDKWHARVYSINSVFEEARIDLGKDVIDEEVVEKVWDRIAPGLASHFDSPYSVPAIVPRPLLIIQGGEDPRCPLTGLHDPISRAQEAYKAAGCPENFQFIAESGIGHLMTKSMVKAASDWFDKFLKP